MLDIKLIRSNPNYVKSAIQKRGAEIYTKIIDDILEIDAKWREATQRVENMKAEQNASSKQIPQIKKQGGDTTLLMNRMKELAAAIKEESAGLNLLEKQQNDLLLTLPNMPDEDVCAGGKENNRVLHQYGEKPQFDFEAKNHVELCESLGLIDYKKGAKLAGAGSWVYTGLGSRLEWALLNFFIEEHLADGYDLQLLPHMLNYECGYVAGQFPKFEDEDYWIENATSADRKFLLPTAETGLVNLHRDEILAEKDLPKKYIAYTPCYRREAGSYRAEERGMIRGHQFNKVEMVQYTTQEGSDAAFAELVGKAEKLMQELGLHYQLSKLAAGDCSFSMARTYDIEVWIPSMGIYKEVSSASNARDYQARRGNMKYRDADKKLRLVHTLNASGLATSRLFPAIVEQFQNADGSVRVPQVLQKYMGIDLIK